MERMCRICLSEYVPMISIENTGLQEVYQKLTLMPFKCETGRPQSVCAFCVVLLRRARRLMETSLRAEQLFAQTLDTGVPITKIQFFPEPPVKLSYVITKNIDYYPKAAPNDLPLEETEECTNIAVKLEEELQVSDFEPCDATDEEIAVKEETVTCTSEIKLSDPACNGLQTLLKANDCDSKSIHTQNGAFSKYPIEIENSNHKETVEAPRPLASTSTNQANSNISCKNLNNSEELGHLRKHTEDKPFECGLCHERFVNKSHLTQHMGTHNGKKQYKCDYCNKNFAYISRLTKHIRSHTGEKPFKCVLCNKSFAQNQQLKIHMRTHTGEKPFKCVLCNKGFANNDCLKSHMHTHTGETYKCDKCNKTYASRPSFIRHFRTHTREKPFECVLCYKRFARSCYLKSHMRRHTGEKPYNCDYCTKNFAERYDLIEHIRTHTGEKPFECVLCNKQFVFHQHFKSHNMRTHPGEKSFECVLCDKKFVRNEHLKVHMRSHTGEKPYKCDHCNKNFVKRFNLTRHIKTHTT